MKQNCNINTWEVDTLNDSEIKQIADEISDLDLSDATITKYINSDRVTILVKKGGVRWRYERIKTKHKNEEATETIQMRVYDVHSGRYSLDIDGEEAKNIIVTTARKLFDSERVKKMEKTATMNAL